MINAQSWGLGGETREVWNDLSLVEFKPNRQGVDKGSDRFWKLCNTPLVGTQVGLSSDVLEQRKSLAFAHFTNHLAKGMVPKVMIFPYDFLLTKKDIKAYISNVLFM